MEIKIKNFSIDQICDSGQCFRMEKNADGIISVIAHGMYVEVKQDGESVDFSCTKEEFNTVWKKYFDIGSETDYDEIIASIDKNDNYLVNAVSFGSGIRILNQDLWEMIISFIISQRNNIKRIRSCIKKLCEKYGEKKSYISEEGREVVYYDFPLPEVLANADIEDLRALGVGYRDVYIKRAAEDVLYGRIDLSQINQMSYEEAKEALLGIFGVGNKVADCICLFALHHTDAFPMDTHIISIMNNEYKGCYPFEKYKGYNGVLQQYMFYFDLNKSR